MLEKLEKSGSSFNTKTIYRDSHDKDKMVVRPSYLYNENSLTGKTASLYVIFHCLSGTKALPEPMLTHHH